MTAIDATQREAAQRYCAQVTHDEARNFFYGIRLLPDAKRQAMCAVYAFARRVDDIGDGELPVGEKRAALGRARDELRAVAAGRGAPADDPVLVALDDAAMSFPIPLDAFEDLIDGVEMDVRGVRYDSFDELVTYCRCVAGSIGRLSIGVFGADNRRAHTLADDLGVAMQLTNIMRDVREDDRNGRRYLPAEDFAAFDCDVAGNGDFAGMMQFEAARAREWFAVGLQLLPLLDRRSAACVSAMSGIYRRLLRRIEADPTAVLERRVSLPTWEKCYVAASSLAGRAP